MGFFWGGFSLGGGLTGFGSFRGVSGFARREQKYMGSRPAQNMAD